jgi:hypothetical protein
MPVKTIRVRVSSVSGEQIPEQSGATVRIRLADGSKAWRADLTDDELMKLVEELNADEAKVRSKKQQDEQDDEPEDAPAKA